MKGSSFIFALRKKFKVSTDRVLADRLGITAQAIQNWKNRKTVTVRQLAGLVYRAGRAGASHLQASAIRPLVEFFIIDRCESKQRANYELFSTQKDGITHPYFEGLRKELEDHHGIFVFFDSRGQAIYTGKARRQNLWKEMNLAFNRERGEIQKIKRVNHPTRKQSYRTSDEKARQITDREIPLYELARYFSAYQVADGLISEVEAMLVRSFANDLLNKRMERFSQQKRKKKLV
jgi:hypothetical protein